jgi:hypothetical protein
VPTERYWKKTIEGKSGSNCQFQCSCRNCESTVSSVDWTHNKLLGFDRHRKTWSLGNLEGWIAHQVSEIGCPGHAAQLRTSTCHTSVVHRATGYFRTWNHKIQVKFEIPVAQGQPHQFWISETLPTCDKQFGKKIFKISFRIQNGVHFWGDHPVFLVLCTYRIKESTHCRTSHQAYTTECLQDTLKVK